MTRAEVVIEDRLFATLDPRARRVALGEEVTAVLTDTVGFIRKLPHDLVAPFRSTLEEAIDADLVLHVVDATHPAADEHLRVGQEVLDGLDVDRDRILVVRNKIDLLGSSAKGNGRRPYRSAAISALSGEGIAELKSVIRSSLLTAPGVAILRVPLEEAELVRRAVAMPHQLARRFADGTFELALRADPRFLVEAGLDGYRVSAWRSGGGDGGR